MAATNRMNRELIKKAEKTIAEGPDCPIELLRAHCLARGATGIKGIALTFKIMDDDGTRSLTMPEFKKGIKDYGVDLPNSKCEELFSKIDADHSGSVDFDEFLIALRPPMSNARKTLIKKAFNKLDKDANGKVTVEDLKGVYSVKKHPKYLSGEMTEEQCLRQFLDSFDSPDDKDGVVTLEEFTNYYAGVSASIDTDAYFDLMMRSAWKM